MFIFSLEEGPAVCRYVVPIDYPFLGRALSQLEFLLLGEKNKTQAFPQVGKCFLDSHSQPMFTASQGRNSSRQEPGGRSCSKGRGGCCLADCFRWLLDCFLWLAQFLFSYILQPHTNDNCAHMGWVLPHQITSQENVPQTCLQAGAMEAFSLFRFLVPR